LRYIRVVRVAGLLAATVFVTATTGCTRDPVGECPAIAPGDLLITEFRGEQSPEDTLGVWVEIFNASPSTIDLEGLKVRFRKKDGSSEVPILVRRSLQVTPGSYVVLGLVPDDATRPAYIDYGFVADFKMEYLPAAAVDLETCGERIDRAVYDQLPDVGTYSYGGALDADSNDIPAMWCTNTSPPGTPQQANPTCPPP
jgi:hypothetical protein